MYIYGTVRHELIQVSQTFIHKEGALNRATIRNIFIKSSRKLLIGNISQISLPHVTTTQKNLTLTLVKHVWKMELE